MIERLRRCSLAFLALLGTAGAVSAAGLEPIQYNNPGLVVDLGVGLWAWPLPMDYDQDGDLDLLVSCPDVPFNGLYFFENPGGNSKTPVFKPPVRLGPARKNIQPSYVDGEVRLLMPAHELVNFRGVQSAATQRVYSEENVHDPKAKLRANQWKYVDFDGDEKFDLIVGVEDWSDYGWDDSYDARGRWMRGPLHGVVYWLRNQGTNAKPNYAKPVKVEAGGRPIDTFGMPSPNLADFDGDGDLDLICGEFVDGLTYFENTGTRQAPVYARGRRLVDEQGKPVLMNLEMIVPVAIDWDKDGDVDLVVGDEDGRVALIEHTGKVIDGLPRFQAPAYFRQEAADVKFGALVTPCSVDWDGDGDEDLVCGNSSGVIGLIENLDGGNPPRWAAPRLLEAAGSPIRIMAGPNGSIQGPCEAKWGYTTLSVADWDRDGQPDLVVNSIWGKVVWYRNAGSRSKPVLEAARPIEVEWPGAPVKPEWTWWEPKGKSLATQWRTTPVVVDWTQDGLPDLVMLDHEGYLALFERIERGGALKLLPPRRLFHVESASEFDANHQPMNKTGGLLRLNAGKAGKSGRRKFCVADWDGDGQLDLLVNTRNVNVLRNTGTTDGQTKFADLGEIDGRILAGHDTSPTVVDWNRDKVSDLLVGAEDGRFYYLKNPRAR
ncbi:FG-GAP repeat domain-containing protein [Singulisphaera acidiphila]|uniref:FG-GAP repeat protein n=1 Tax=Singulisphaera acidiphila (strain ATCC BAA-1392 / DSM 18658 / VKM B-2454 / MOB10) TaxID=886293 RepID=L0DHR3_SINAD|nr:VCBS repeat-containing protein [Singulisphaera acidiphila]AGA28807.1 FG-GAP repeat protein [Singulisphaera acidiphila DSM 18658]